MIHVIAQQIHDWSGELEKLRTGADDFALPLTQQAPRRQNLPAGKSLRIRSRDFR